MISTPNRNQELFLYSVLAALMALPFISDLLLPLGTAVWVIYIFPVALAYLARAPFVPLILAAMATILTAVGYMWGPVGVEPELALFNRILGVIKAWVERKSEEHTSELKQLMRISYAVFCLQQKHQT